MPEIIPNSVPCGKKPDPKPTPTPKPPCPKPDDKCCGVNGVTYFKFDSGIPGDRNNQCGLLGSQIDMNFFFLRCKDIETGYTKVTEDGKKILVLKRVKCLPDIEIDITANNVIDMCFKDGYLYVNDEPVKDCESGEPIKFLTEGTDIHVVTDASIQGNGSCDKPLGVDLAYRTGTYAPANRFADFTNSGISIELFENSGYGYTLVTKENASDFGALYNYWQVEAITQALIEKDCFWRVPTVDDWGKLLNSLECPEDRNHITLDGGNFGKVAGERLKSQKYWKTEDEEHEPLDDVDMCIYPVGVCPEISNTRNPEDYGFAGLYEMTSFWESGVSNGMGYVRTFSYGHNDVAQFLEPKVSRRSLRLVLDVTDETDVPEFAEILGNQVPVVYIPEAKQLWTKVNIDFPGFGGLVPEEWEGLEGGPKFFYNVWDGKKWHKKLMKEGESVVILEEDYENPYDTAATPYVTSANTNHEWRIFVDEETGLVELIDTVEAIKDSIDVGDLEKALADEISARTAEDEYLQEQIDALENYFIEPLDESIIVPPVSGNTAYVGVNIDYDDKHIIIGDNGLYFDGDFKDEDEDDE